MQSVAPLLQFDTHDASGELPHRDAASAALHELAHKLGYAKAPEHPCTRGTAAFDEARVGADSL